MSHRRDYIRDTINIHKNILEDHKMQVSDIVETVDIPMEGPHEHRGTTKLGATRLLCLLTPDVYKRQTTLSSLLAGLYAARVS